MKINVEVEFMVSQKTGMSFKESVMSGIEKENIAQEVLKRIYEASNRGTFVVSSIGLWDNENGKSPNFDGTILEIKIIG